MILTDAKGEEHAYTFPARSVLLVKHGERIEAGTQLNEGSLYPAELLEIRGRTETEATSSREVQRVYKAQGVDINDKHIELIVRQMMKKVRDRVQGLDHAAAGRARGPAQAQGDQQAGQGRGRHAGQGRGGDPRDHQGLAGDRVVPLGGLLPGDDQGAHRRRPGGQARQARRPEGERDHRQADPGRDRPASTTARSRSSRSSRPSAPTRTCSTRTSSRPSWASAATARSRRARGLRPLLRRGARGARPGDRGAATAPARRRVPT